VRQRKPLPRSRAAQGQAATAPPTTAPPRQPRRDPEPPPAQPRRPRAVDAQATSSAEGPPRGRASPPGPRGPARGTRAPAAPPGAPTAAALEQRPPDRELPREERRNGLVRTEVLGPKRRRLPRNNALLQVVDLVRQRSRRVEGVNAGDRNVVKEAPRPPAPGR
jgi:hypothetical protein